MCIAIYYLLLLCVHVELVTFASRNCAEAMSSPEAISALIDLISQSNRSSASFSIVKTVLKIFQNLCKVSVRKFLSKCMRFCKQVVLTQHK